MCLLKILPRLLNVNTVKELSLKVLHKIVAEEILNFFSLFFSEKIFRLDILCQCIADDSHEMSSLNFTEKYKKKKIIIIIKK